MQKKKEKEKAEEEKTALNQIHQASSAPFVRLR